MPAPADAVIQQIHTLPFYDGFSVSQGFNPPSHYGIDYVVGSPGPGERIVAAATGTVKRCPFDQYGAGQYLVMSHWNATGHITRYLHLLEYGPATPADGAGVARGQTIGFEGSTGNSTGPHLHFETRVDATTFTCGFDGTAMDPNAVYTTSPPPYAAGRRYYPLDSTNAGRYPGVFRPMTNGTWWHERFSNTSGIANRSFIFASICDIPVVGDWNNDGVETPGVFRPYGATGSEWHISNNVNGSGSSVYVFGTPTDWPVVGDWNGDGYTTIGLWRPSTAFWYLRNANNTDAGAVPAFGYGTPGLDRPVVGNWDSDADSNIGVFRAPDTSWHLREINTTGPPTIPPFQYGSPGDYPITGDWNWDGRDTIGIFRSTGIYAEWHLRNFNSAGGPSITPFTFGVISDKPITGDWN